MNAMRINFYNNLNFCKYLSSKYSRDTSLRNITNPVYKNENVPSTLDLTDANLTNAYSKRKIRELYRYFRCNKNSLDKESKKLLNGNINKLMSKLSKGDIDSSNIGMILDLIRDKKLHPEILYSVYNAGISRHINDDLTKLYEAYANSDNMEDVFVPPFKTKQEALFNIKVGDVCKIDGYDNIFTKLPDGSIKELFITPATYLELFPPVERFIIRQSDAADCYILAAFDSVNQNPNSRHKLFEMFKENPDGTVDIVFGGFKRDENNKIIPNNSDAIIMEDISSKISDFNEDSLSYTTEALRAFEVLFEYNSKQIFSKKQKDAIETGISEYRMLQQCLKTGKIPVPKHIQEEEINKAGTIKKYKNKYRKNRNNAILFDNEIFYSNEAYKKEEIDLFLSFVNSGKEIIAITDRIYDSDTCFVQAPMVLREKIVNKLAEFQNCDNDDIERFSTLCLQRAKRYLDKSKDNLYVFKGVMPKEAYSRLFDTDIIKENREPYDEGGDEGIVFGAIGLNLCCDYGDEFRTGDKDTEEFLFSNNIDQYVFTCTKDKYKDDTYCKEFKIYSNHSYSLEPTDIDNERKFIVRNPHNSMYEAIFTYEELCEHFDGITIAKTDK